MKTMAVKFTEADYMKLPEGFPAQLVDGMLVKEAAPRPWHQILLSRIHAQLLEQLPADRVLFSPVDVFIDEFNVFQPDVCLFSAGAEPGPATERVEKPVIVIEVLSPTTKRIDRFTKTDIYLRAGIREVWLVDPDQRRIEVFSKKAHVSVAAGEVVSRAVGVRVDLDRLFRVT